MTVFQTQQVRDHDVTPPPAQNASAVVAIQDATALCISVMFLYFSVVRLSHAEGRCKETWRSGYSET
jgi:hypothetical protein